MYNLFNFDNFDIHCTSQFLVQFRLQMFAGQVLTQPEFTEYERLLSNLPLTEERTSSTTTR